MKFNTKHFLAGLLAVPVIVAGALVPAVTVGAAPGQIPSISEGASAAQGNDHTVTDLTGQDGLFKQATNLLLFLIGAVSVIMIVIGGIRYTVSGGEASAIEGAKNTILYSVVGLVVALLGFAIVNFVVTNL